MNDTDTLLDSVHNTTATIDSGGLSRFLRIYRRWKKRHSLYQLPSGSVRLLVTERLHERELFLHDVRKQLLELETSVDELTETIRSMRGSER